MQRKGIATPISDPPAGYFYEYFKVDGNLYSKNSAGAETQLSGGGGEGGWTDDGGNVRLTTVSDTVSIGTAAPDSSSLLELVSTTKGFLIPRGTTIQRDAIVAPATALMFYDTDDNDIDYFNGTNWRSLVDAPAASLIAGSVIFATGNNSVTDDNDNFFWDNTNDMLGIRTNTPNYMLDMGVNTYVSIDSLFGHIIQHNNASAQFWGLATRNNGNYGIATTTADPRPSGGIISSSNEKVTITPDANVGINLEGVTPSFRIHTSVEDGNNYIGIDAYGNEPGFIGQRANGTRSAPTVAVDGSNLMSLKGRGWTGSSFSGTRVELLFESTQTYTSTANGTLMTFLTTPNGSTSRTRRMTIDEDGGIFMLSIKSGTTQGGAGAAVDELWVDTNDDNTIKLGV